MSMSCVLCAKKAARANHVSHSNVKVPRRQKPNLQLLRLGSQSLRICSSCRRTLSKRMTTVTA